MPEIKYGIDVNLDGNELKNAVAHRVTTTERGTLGSGLTAAEAGQFAFDTTDGNLYIWNGASWVNATQVVANPMTIKGEISNADTNPAYPVAPTAGDTYIIVSNSGTVGSQTVEVGDQLIYSTSGWFIFQANLSAATTTLAGYVRLATQGEVNTGTDNATAVTPLTLKTLLDAATAKKPHTQAIPTLTANTPLTITHNLALLNPLAYTIQVNSATGELGVGHIGVTANTLTIETKKTYTDLYVIIFGK